MNETEELKELYLEEVRWFIWYTGSPYSFHKGKTSKELAEKSRIRMHELFAAYIKSKNRP